MSNKDPYEIKIGFKPDSAFKFLFTNLSNEVRIRMLNSLFEIELPIDSEIVVLNTENVVLNGVNDCLENTRADLIFGTDYARKVLVLFCIE